MLCAVVGVLFVVGIATGSLADGGLFGIAVLLVVLGGVAALAVPWSRLPPAAVAVIPVVDIVAITLLRISDPAAAFGLLWVFPAMWLSTLGRLGFAVAALGIPAVYWVVLATGSSSSGTYAVVLLPIVVIAVSAASYASARRYSAQRSLLDRQAVRVSAAHREALRQEQLVSEVLDTVDFGVIRLAESGEVVLENDALIRFGHIPGFLPAGADAAEVLDEKLAPLVAEQHPLVRLQRRESFDDIVLWFALADGSHACFIGRSGGTPIGFALLRFWNAPERVTLVRRVAVTTPGRGDGRRLLSAVVAHAFRETEVHRLQIGLFPDNLRACRAYEAVGFVAEGISRGSAFFGGVFRDELVMSLLRPEWEALNRG